VSADVAATWVAAAATIVVFGGLMGEKRVFALAQHLFAGLVTGYLALVAISEVIVPRVVEPLLTAPARLDAWGLAILAVLTVASPWLPRIATAVPFSILIGSLAAFALVGAVVGTVLPQAAAAIVPAGSAASVLVALLALAISVLVIVALLHDRPAGPGAAAAGIGRWVLIGGLGGWVGYLLVTRLALLVDRVDFLVGDWLGIGR
jgi:hypothetical protein